MKTLFKNARIVKETGICENGYVLIEDSIILSAGEGCPEFKADTVVDVENKYLSAGIIDIHQHGGNRHAYIDGTFEAMESIAKFHSDHGITSIYPTLSTAKDEEVHRFLKNYDEYASKISCVNFLGVHLEGPYFSMAQRGAQDPRYLKNPEKEHYEGFLAYGCVRRISAAPELDGALEMGRELEKRGIIAAIGHSDTDYEKILEAFENGYNLCTHLYSGMSVVHRKDAFRYGGVVEAGLLLDELYTEVIADGCHLPECLLKLIYKCKGYKKIILVTDAIRGAGLQNGEILKDSEGNIKQIIEDDVAKVADRSCFAGSIASGDRLIRTMTKIAGVPLHEAIYMASMTPAEVMGVDNKKGSIEPGKDADIILFDEDINIDGVYVMGKKVK